jgi:hypothetical protein
VKKFAVAAIAAVALWFSAGSAQAQTVRIQLQSGYNPGFSYYQNNGFGTYYFYSGPTYGYRYQYSFGNPYYNNYNPYNNPYNYTRPYGYYNPYANPYNYTRPNYGYNPWRR